MKLNSAIKPLIYGTWLLRNTNDLNVDNKLNNSNYLIIDNDNIVKFKSLDSNCFFGIKKSRTAEIRNLVKNNDTFTLQFRFLKKNTYTYSFFGIEIPEIKTKSEDYNYEKNINVNLFHNILLIIDNDLSLYYIFDLYQGKIKTSNIETHFNTFIFTQLFGIIIGFLINKIIS
jgi:hypothetical protein